jgi:hypothetical protein
MMNFSMGIWCFVTMLLLPLHFSLATADVAPTAATATTARVEYIGHSKTPIAILDNVLPENAYTSLRDELRSRTDFFEGHAKDVSFPGKIAVLDRQIVDPIINVLFASTDVLEHFPKEIFEQPEFIRGFASILCYKGWVHNDYMENELGNVVAPAAVFYFGYDGTSSSSSNGNNLNTKLDTGTAFFREKKSGLERLTSVRGNETKFCGEFPGSIACLGDASDAGLAGSKAGVEGEGDEENWASLVSGDHGIQHEHEDSRFEETFRVLGKPNRLVLYSQDVLHNAWVERKEQRDADPVLPCSAKKGRLAISLFFLSKHGGQKIVDVLGSAWKTEATHQLRGGGGLVYGGDIGRNVPETVEDTAEDRRKLMEWRRLVACPAFTLGETFVVVGVASCSMSATVNVGDGQQLRVRGLDGLDHPVLDRGGVAGASVLSRHFVLTGTAKMTLMNLELTGAWVGTTDSGCKSCGYCQKTVSGDLISNLLECTCGGLALFGYVFIVF